MHNDYGSLFTPVKIGKVELKNRIAMAPMSNAGLVNNDGSFNARGEEYFVERARGGVGLIITGFTEIEDTVENKMPGTAQNVFANPYNFVLRASEITERVHAYNCKIFLQLTLGFGRVGFSPYITGHPVAPSAIPNFWHPEVTCRELATAEVESIVRSAGKAAAVAKESGFDGVEIHAMHEGYLLDQFAMAMFNRRTDKYGGDLDGRLRFALEVLESIKTAAGGDYPVVLRYGVKSFIKDWNKGALPDEDFVERGRDVEEALEIAPILERAGYDALDADCGSYEAWYWAHPPGYHTHGCYLPYVKRLKEVVGLPILTSGRMEMPELAARSVEQGLVDVVMLGRGLLAEPQWANKVLRGRVDDLRPCLGCHDGCITREDTNKALSCAVNPACGRESLYGISPALVKKRVLIVGGGVAGMEAARVSALRGHSVTLYEKGGSLGGHLLEASVPDFKEDERRLVKWYQKQLADLRVAIHLNRAADVDSADGFDIVVVATGSTSRNPPIKGADGVNVVLASDMLLHPRLEGERVAIVGGGLVGCEIALWLAGLGKHVCIVELLEDLMSAGPAICPANRQMLVDSLRLNGVEVCAGAGLLEIAAGEIEIIDKTLRRSRRRADTVVLALGYAENDGLYRQLVNRRAEVYLIGDAARVRNIMGAVWDAYEVARSL